MRTIKQLRIEFYLNDKLTQDIVTPETTALSFIREQLGLTGSKEVCAEGDCGACTIAIGRYCNATNAVVFQTVNSCILPAAKLHGSYVYTIEGLAKEGKLNAIQQAMLDNHAVQCGYCTAGMVMSLFGLLINNPQPSENDIFAALEGNLCRCTGYKAIHTAALTLTENLKNNANFSQNLLPLSLEIIKNRILQIPPAIQTESVAAFEIDSCNEYIMPRSVTELFTAMANLQGSYKIISGGTDVMVAANLHDIWPKHFIDIAAIPELNTIVGDDRQITIGATATFSQIVANALVREKLPILKTALLQMSSTQIRNMGTLGGNIANASPIADAACVLLALDAELVLLSATGERKVKLADFYRDYKATALNPATEIIAKAVIPVTKGWYSFEKTARRSALDIAAVNSAMNVEFNDDQRVTAARVVFGGVHKFPALAKRVSEYLVGKGIDDNTIAQAAILAAEEFQPISDVRGSSNYRKQLIHNHVIKHLNALISKL